MKVNKHLKDIENVLNRPKKTVLMFLKKWSLVIIKGTDSKTYLQGQLTNNILNLNINNYLFSAHCNSSGKVLSNMIIFLHDDGYAYIQRKSICNIQINELQKYAIFSNVKVHRSRNYYILGMFGKDARIILKLYFRKIPNKQKQIVKLGNNYIIWLDNPIERFLIVISSSDYISFITLLKGNVLLNNGTQWETFDIEIGYPIVDKENCYNYLPQEINLKNFYCIDFQKGCYQGQEIIARYNFRNIIKRNMYWLVGKADEIPLPGDYIEVNKLNSWNIQGKVLSAIEIKETNIIYVQSILKSGLAKQNILRIFNNVNSFFKIYKIFI